MSDQVDVVAIFNGLRPYFQSHDCDPVEAMTIMAYAIGVIRGVNGLRILDQSLCDSIAAGYNDAAKYMDKPIPRPEKGKVV